jgi:hypothetical protein
VERFPEHNVLLVVLEPEVYEAVLAHLPDVLQDVVRFAYLTGWRRGQIVRLIWQDVHPEVIHLSGTTVQHKDVQVLSLVGESRGDYRSATASSAPRCSLGFSPGRPSHPGLSLGMEDSACKGWCNQLPFSRFPPHRNAQHGLGPGA